MKTKPIMATWILGGICLVSSFLVTAFLSHHIDPKFDVWQPGDMGLVAVWVLAGVAYLTVIWAITRNGVLDKRNVFFWTLALGALMRGAMFFSSPLYEDDYHRYLWDGAVVANGNNPYLFSPQEVKDGMVPQALVELGRHPRAPLNSINHPSLRTIYPPIAQATFALAYWIRPFDLFALRGVFLLFDIACMLMVLFLLARLDRPREWIAIYWLNPVLLVTLLNQCHMDGLLFPLVLGAVLLAVRHQMTWALTLLALSVGVKVWPFFLLPILIRGAWTRPGKWLPGVLVFVAILAILCLPILHAGLDQNSGFVRYAEAWHNNAPFFEILTHASLWVCHAFGFHSAHGHVLARLWVALALVVFVFWRSLPRIRNAADLIWRCTTVIGALFLLSPTQFPWYFCWILPFLALRPWWPFLLYAALLPLYHLHYAYPWLAWVEHGPVLVWLVYEQVAAWRGKAGGCRLEAEDGRP